MESRRSQGKPKVPLSNASIDELVRYRVTLRMMHRLGDRDLNDYEVEAFVNQEMGRLADEIVLIWAKLPWDDDE